MQKQEPDKGQQHRALYREQISAILKDPKIPQERKDAARRALELTEMLEKAPRKQIGKPMSKQVGPPPWQGDTTSHEEEKKHNGSVPVNSPDPETQSGELQRGGKEWDLIKLGRDAADPFFGGRRALTLEEDKNDWIRLGYDISRINEFTHEIRRHEGLMMLLGLSAIVLVVMASFGYTFYGAMHFAALLAIGPISIGITLKIRENLNATVKIVSDHDTDISTKIPLSSAVERLLRYSNFGRQIVYNFRNEFWQESSWHYWTSPMSLILLFFSIIFPLAFGLSFVLAVFNGDSGWYNYLGKFIYSNP